MIVRVRSRDGVERVEVPENGSVEHLYTAVSTQLKIPYIDLHLSKDAKLLLFGASRHQFTDLVRKGMALKTAGVENGTVVFALYSGERNVQPVYQKPKFEERLFGDKMTIDEMVAQQVRIERQAKAVAASVSFDHHAANAFQAYVRSVLGFSIKRGGLLYGSVDEENNVRVEFVYEPMQHGTGLDLLMERQTEEELLVDLIAENLGMRKVGWIFAQSSEERDFIVSAGELKQMASMQTEMGDTAITAVVSLDTSEEEGHVHFEAYQCSKQCVDLFNRKWFAEDGENGVGMIQMKHPDNPKDHTPVIIAGKDVAEVDNDFFLCPVNILDHQGPLLCTFPIENRLLSQSKTDLKEALTAASRGDYRSKLSDFHLLLYLAGKLDRGDLIAICHSIQNEESIMEGYRFLIDSLAGL